MKYKAGFFVFCSLFVGLTHHAFSMKKEKKKLDYKLITSKYGFSIKNEETGHMVTKVFFSVVKRCFVHPSMEYLCVVLARNAVKVFETSSGRMLFDKQFGKDITKAEFVEKDKKLCIQFRDKEEEIMPFLQKSFFVKIEKSKHLGERKYVSVRD